MGKAPNHSQGVPRRWRNKTVSRVWRTRVQAERLHSPFRVAAEVLVPGLIRLDIRSKSPICRDVILSRNCLAIENEEGRGAMRVPLIQVLLNSIL